MSASEPPKTYLALGDSYTIGESVAEHERWPVQLAAMLRQRNTDMGQPAIIARTGWTTAELAQAIDKSGDANRYGLVSLLIGVNNQYRGQSRRRYRHELAMLLRTATRFAGGHATRVLVLSIPDWGVSPFAKNRNRRKIARQIDAFNAVCRRETAKAGAHFFDITPLSRTAATDPTLIAADGLHFSGKMYRQWMEMIVADVENIVNQPPSPRRGSF